jgi:hypothetical protein
MLGKLMGPLLGIRTALISFALLRNYIGLGCVTLIPVLLLFNPLERPLLQDIEALRFLSPAVLKSLTVFLYSLMHNVWTLSIISYLFALWAGIKSSCASIMRIIAGRSTALLIWSTIIALVDFGLGSLSAVLPGETSKWHGIGLIVIAMLQLILIAAWQIFEFLLLPRLADHTHSFSSAMRWVWNTILTQALLIISSLFSLFFFAGLLYAPLIPQLLHQLIPKLEPETLGFLLNLLVSPWIVTATILLTAMTYRIVVPGPSTTVRFTHMSNWQLLGRAIATLLAILAIATTITGLIAFAITQG